MRFNLTHASYRIFERATRLRLQSGISAISAAKILWAIFEEECRAAQWLADAGLTLDQFKAAFGIQTLQSPISAPAFPAGSYGITSNTAGTGTSAAPKNSPLETASAGNNAPPVGNPFPEQQPPEEETQNTEESTPPAREEDDWQHTEPPKYTLYEKPSTKPAGERRLQFYLDDQRLDFGLITPELENNLLLIAHQCTRQTDSGHLTSGGLLPPGWNSVMTFSLATEHLLLAALLDNSDTGRWLHENGFDPAEVYGRINNLTANSAEIPMPAPTAPPHAEREETGRLPLAVCRLFDAAANRCRESMRVIEDYVRFILNDAELTQQLKTFRHELQFTLQTIPMAERLSARETEQDVGTAISARGEYDRSSPEEVMDANFSRLQEALRSLEEFSKMFDSAAAEQFERQRYRCYTLHKTAAMNSRKKSTGTPDGDLI